MRMRRAGSGQLEAILLERAPVPWVVLYAYTTKPLVTRLYDVRAPCIFDSSMAAAWRQNDSSDARIARCITLHRHSFTTISWLLPFDSTKHIFVFSSFKNSLSGSLLFSVAGLSFLLG